MKRKLSRAYFYLIILILTGCEGSLVFYPPDLPEKLCIIGIIDADDTTRSITFEKSIQWSYPETNGAIDTNLSFRISSTDNDIYSYKSDKSLSRKNPVKIPGNLSFTSGEKYTLFVDEKTTGGITSETLVPEVPGALSVSYDGSTTEDLPPPFDCLKSFKSVILKLSFPVEKDSYYLILIEGQDTYWAPRIQSCYVAYDVIENSSVSFSAWLPDHRSNDLGSCWVSSFVRPTKNLYGSFIDGRTIPTNICNIKIKIGLFNSVKVGLYNNLFDFKRPITVKLCSITNEFYLFEKSLYLKLRNETDPFSEPVFTNGNIRGGEGIFTIYRSTEQSITVPWEAIFQTNN